MLFALEARLGEQLDIDAPVMFWLIEYVSELINRCKVQAHDGMTAYQRKFGQTDDFALAGYGETVHFMPLGADKDEDRDNKLYKAEPRFQLGVFLGIERDSNEYRMCTPTRTGCTLCND